jgi:phospholipase C
MVFLRTCVLLGALALSACSASPVTIALPATASAQRVGLVPSTPIKHVVIIVQENRTFNNFFSGYPGAVSSRAGKGFDGSIIPLTPITFAAAGLSHGYTPEVDAYNRGKMNGFALYPPGQILGSFAPPRFYAYSYVERSLIEPYWDMAQQYTLADHMFPTEWGASFTGHQMLFAGTTQVLPNAVEVETPSKQPWDCNAPAGTVTSLLTNKKVYLQFKGPFPCFSYASIADVLDAGHISWKYYFPYTSDTDPPSDWDAPATIHKIRYGPDYANVLFKPGQVLTDGKAGKLPAVSWVIPDYLNADYPNDGSDTGPSWVSAIVNSIGEGPEWKSTAIVVLWDDWGGWYDPVAPPQNSYYGLGFRVPCLIISPYARQGYVSHTQYEFGSVLKTVEQIFGLPAIGNTDVRANGMLDSFDFTKPPRAFKPIASKYSVQYFRNQVPSNKPQDDE